jgi:hypothetical protein
MQEEFDSAVLIEHDVTFAEGRVDVVLFRDDRPEDFFALGIGINPIGLTRLSPLGTLAFAAG